jgi:AraC-like DNA-binding protein
VGKSIARGAAGRSVTAAVGVDGAVGAGGGPADVLDARLFHRLRREYRESCGMDLQACDAEGRTVFSSPRCGAAPCTEKAACDRARWMAIREALRWGEPCVNLCPRGNALWGMPVMVNNECVGGLIVAGVPLERIPSRARPASPARVRRACEELSALVVRFNLVSSALLEMRRSQSERERKKAEAIHELKTDMHDSIREIYLREEPSLLAAIRQGDRGGAREILNRVLVAIYHVGAGRLDLLKSFLLELVVMMCRAAVEAGGNPSELLGVNFDSLSNLSRISDEVALSGWLTEHLERLLDGIRESRSYPNTVLLANAVRYMSDHLADDISREEVALAAGLSESHYSRLIREKTGRTYVDLLAQFRVDRACELMSRTTKSLVQIALECGFTTQSYFTRVFRRYTNLTPRAYSREHAPKD